MTEPINDYIVLRVPDSFVLDEGAWAVLDRLAEGVTMNQYKGRRPKALVMDHIEWRITSDWRDVEEFQPEHDCVTCRAANDQAIAYLREFPEGRLALGNLRYLEVW
jgi:hypothetical protein